MSTVSIVGFIAMCLLIYGKETRLVSVFNQRSTVQKIAVFAAVLLISFLFASQLTLSPTNNYLYNRSMVDSSVFLYIGKSMRAGLVPYKDLFDHKGIVLYFLEYIGCLIGFGSPVGVWVIELLNVMLTGYILYKIAGEFSESKTLCLLSVFLVLRFCSIDFFEGGNLVEEFALPWIALTLYYVVCFFKNNAYKPTDIILIGISFTVVFFLRVNMVGLWGALILCVLIAFAKDKKYADFFKSIALFVLGCAIVIVPIAAYLVFTHSLEEMIECYFKFNFSYTGSDFGMEQLKLFTENCISHSLLALIFIAFSFLVQPKNKCVYINLFGLIVAFLSSAVSGRNYLHYCMILIPFFIIPAILSVDTLMKGAKNSIAVPKNKALASALVVLCLIVSVLYPAQSYYETKTAPAPAGNEVAAYLDNNTTAQDDVLLLGNSVVYYLQSDRTTKNRFFYQFPPVAVSDKIYDDFIAELNKKPSDYILRIGDRNRDESWNRINDYLDEKCQTGEYTLEEYNGFQVFVKNK